MSPNAWMLVFIHETRRSSDTASSLGDSSAYDRTSVSANITASSAGSRAVQITNLDFADDEMIFAETIKETLESLSEEAEPLGPRPTSRRSLSFWMRPLSQFL